MIAKVFMPNNNKNKLGRMEETEQKCLNPPPQDDGHKSKCSFVLKKKQQQ